MGSIEGKLDTLVSSVINLLSSKLDDYQLFVNKYAIIMTNMIMMGTKA